MFVKEITKRYDGKAVVDGVSFEIPKGKVLSLIGPNGAGKIHRDGNAVPPDCAGQRSCGF